MAKITSSISETFFHECHICGYDCTQTKIPKLSLVNHIRQQHPKTYNRPNWGARYLKKFYFKGESPTCKHCGDITGIEGFKTVRTFCSPTCASQWNLENNPETKKKLSRAMKTMWESEGFRDRIAETRRMSEAYQNSQRNGYVARMSFEERSVARRAMWQRQRKDAEFMKNWSNAKSRVASRALKEHPRFGYANSKTSFYYGRMYRSSWEVRFAKKCHEYEIEFEYEPRRFTYRKPNGHTGRYTPDFYLPEFGTWVEIKPLKYQDTIATLKLETLRRKTKEHCVFLDLDQINKLSNHSLQILSRQ